MLGFKESFGPSLHFLMISIKPNKKASLVGLALTLILLILSYIYVGAEEKLVAFHIFDVSGATIRTTLILLLIFYAANLIYVNFTRRYIVLNQFGIKLSDYEKIRWEQIETVDLYRVEFLVLGAMIRLKDERKILIRWNRLGCGSRRFVEMMLLYIRDKDMREELGVM